MSLRVWVPIASPEFDAIWAAVMQGPSHQFYVIRGVKVTGSTWAEVELERATSSSSDEVEEVK